jgi:hypothetical protein
MSIEQASKDFMRKYGDKSVKRKHKKRLRNSFSGGQGWENESERHQMASYGIKTGRKAREYSPKTTFKSAPLIKAGIGLGLKGIGVTARFLAKRKADAERKKAEEQKQQQEKEIQEAPLRLIEAEELRKKNIQQEKINAYKQAQLRAVQTKENQYARVLEARKRRQEQIDKDYASV